MYLYFCNGMSMYTSPLDTSTFCTYIYILYMYLDYDLVDLVAANMIHNEINLIFRHTYH